MSHASTASWALNLLPSGITSAVAAVLAWVGQLPSAIIFTISVVVFALIFLCTLAWLGHREQRRVTIQTGLGSDYNIRRTSNGGILHIVRAKIINRTGNILTDANLSVVNLNPANAGGRNFPLASGITLTAGEDMYVNVASHTEGIETDQHLMCLQTSYPGGFLTRSGILTGEHRLQLQLMRNEKVFADIYCRLYVDDHNVMRLVCLESARNEF
jgi:hypothetical protein